MTLDELNALSVADAREALARCYGAPAWVAAMCDMRPFDDRDALRDAAMLAASRLARHDWVAAFAHHPRIGDVASLRERFASTAAWAGGEQQGATRATDDVLEALARGNRAYEQRFGYIFIVCATGKTAPEMQPAILESRIGNDPDRELEIAAGEQMAITRLRLDKLLEER